MQTTSTSAVSKSFEELFLDTIKPLKPGQSNKRNTDVSTAQVTNLSNCWKDNSLSILFKK